jgi:hypothetical protein
MISARSVVVSSYRPRVKYFLAISWPNTRAQPSRLKAAGRESILTGNFVGTKEEFLAGILCTVPDGELQGFCAFLQRVPHPFHGTS